MPTDYLNLIPQRGRGRGDRVGRAERLGGDAGGERRADAERSRDAGGRLVGSGERLRRSDLRRREATGTAPTGVRAAPTAAELATIIAYARRVHRRHELPGVVVLA